MDAVTFTEGIGENNPYIKKLATEGLSYHRILHVSTDEELILTLENGIYQYDSDSQLVTKLIGSDAEE